eukprot:TRINITY_DN8282_c2_g4_i1.p1 TRINITY_DN8282_c2_g4~~TRINITY_DN8282_c2_g4_i1.p1  ORF type:complete len:570 (+),score=196.58 TRINITY_DN8282_c2_g4_i1:104-1813(+)
MADLCAATVATPPTGSLLGSSGTIALGGVGVSVESVECRLGACAAASGFDGHEQKAAGVGDLAAWMPEKPGGSNEASGGAAASRGVDLDAWRGDLRRMHVTIEQVVQSFIANQTRQLDAVAAELASQQERIQLKERRFTELSDSIANFVEEEAQRLEGFGLRLLDSEEQEARREAYDLECPGPSALHRMNRLWRKATKAFQGAREAADREREVSLEEQRRQHEAALAESLQRQQVLENNSESAVAALRAELEALRCADDAKATTANELRQEIESLQARLTEATAGAEAAREQCAKQVTAADRAEYERSAEREELERKQQEAEAAAATLRSELEECRGREASLEKRCAERAEKVEQMRRLMDDQERELNQKIERVQQYVKERQTGAYHAEKKQQDAERLAERWQGEVRRLQAEKDQLAKLVLELESHKTDQGRRLQGTLQQHEQDVSALRRSLQEKEEEMRNANLELMRKREEEYNSKVGLERQREKDRSVALLRKKELELQVKDQQLRALRQRLRDMGCSEDGAGGAAGAGVAGDATAAACAASSPSGASHRRALGADGGLPPLPLSAR